MSHANRATAPLMLKALLAMFRARSCPIVDDQFPELLAHADRLLVEAMQAAAAPSPTIVCLCGSTRFGDAFRAANLSETLAGRIVLSVGCDTKSDDALGLDPTVKVALDELHKRKIDLCDEVLVLNVDQYIGQSTWSEIAYAFRLGKRLRYLEAPKDWAEVCAAHDLPPLI